MHDSLNASPDTMRTSQTPFALNCESCGAAMSFDIVQQRYGCSQCGNVAPIQSQEEKIQKWAQQQRSRDVQKDNRMLDFQCPNCGAAVKSQDDSQTLKCHFCGTALVKRDFAESDNFPVAMIPFAILPEEAESILDDWISKHANKQEAKRLSGSAQQLRGIYLPYQMYSGPIGLKINRINAFNDKVFEAHSYMNQKNIVACSNVPNALLDEIEPFDNSQLKPFDFVYLAGLQAKTQEKSPQDLEVDFNSEIQSDLGAAIGRTLGTAYSNIVVDDAHVTSVPVLLPIYYLHHNGIYAAVNGQTGQLSVLSHKEKRKFPWVLEPLFLTLLSWLIPSAIIAFVDREMLHSFGDYLGVFFFKTEFPTFVIIIFVALLSFIFYSDGKEAILVNKYFGSKNQFNRGEDKRLISKDRLILKSDIEPAVFWDAYREAQIPVDLKFYPLRRVVKMFLAYAFFIGLPYILVTLVYPGMSGDGDLNPFMSKKMITGSAAWLSLMIPAGLILWMRVVRQDVYDKPYIKPYGEQALYRPSWHIQPLFKRMGAFFSRIRGLGVFSVIIFLIYLFFLVGTVSAMLFNFDTF